MDDLPKPKYLIGSRVFFGRAIEGKESLPCPDCLGEGDWKLTSPAGECINYKCPRCDGKKVISQYSWEPNVQALTIGSIRIDTSRNSDPIEYMCSETGVGSGSVYRERALCDTEEAAMGVAKLDAADCIARADKNNPKREKWRELSTYQLRDAMVRELEDRTRDAEYDLRSLIGAIHELDSYPVAKRIDDDGDDGEVEGCSLSEDQIRIIQNRLVTYNPRARKALLELRQDERECL